MFRQLDRSRTISRSLEGLSARLARRRGLLPLIGVLLVVISFVIRLIMLASPLPILDLAWTLTHHIGILMALIGLLLVEPLGR
jgi:TRAP-type mannitol/chloroaromatic compound transport system permease small subunit